MSGGGKGLHKEYRKEEDEIVYTQIKRGEKAGHSGNVWQAKF